jgi:hypothetical protein
LGNGEEEMRGFNWCHGPECHKKHTVDRVRGVKGSKVLRTRKVKPYSQPYTNFYDYFCSNGCYNDFANTHIREIVAIAPRTECLETPIEDPVKVKPYENANWYNWEIKEVDNNSNP